MEAANESPPTATGAITAIKEYWAKTTSYILGLNSAISQSTFGRIFRLGGSGHVSFRDSIPLPQVVRGV